jgi:hypothetical protein
MRAEYLDLVSAGALVERELHAVAIFIFQMGEAHCTLARAGPRHNSACDGNAGASSPGAVSPTSR